MLINERCPDDSTETCSFCEDNPAKALWMGKIDIFACSHCAIEHLPQLMADAIVGSLSIEQLQTSTGPTYEISKESRIRERFHSAFSSALIRKIRAT